MLVSTQRACELLLEHDNIVILAHQKPDGDTLGSCFALLYALESLGKTARVESRTAYRTATAFCMESMRPRRFLPAMR